MKYSSFKTRWSWTHDPLGSQSYNVLGAFECVLINVNLIQRVNEWGMDEMERYSYKFSNEVNFFTPSSIEGFLELTKEDIDGLYSDKKR